MVASVLYTNTFASRSKKNYDVTEALQKFMFLDFMLQLFVTWVLQYAAHTYSRFGHPCNIAMRKKNAANVYSPLGHKKNLILSTRGTLKFC